MQHVELKSLLWGKHLSRMLGVCGVPHLPPDPAPRIVPPVPQWFQRLAGVLSILGLIALIHVVDSALRYEPVPSPWWDGTSATALDTTAWTRWVSANAAGASASLPADGLPGMQHAGKRSSGSLASRWINLTASPLAVPRQRPRPAFDQKYLFRSIQVTAYTSRASETDSTPDLTASNTKPKPGTIALSRDLLKDFTPDAPFQFGDKLLIPGVGVFEAHDTMHPRWKGKADIWFASAAKARAWGQRTVFVTKVGTEIPTMANQIF